MEDAAILLCRRADKTIAIILSQNLDFESLVSRLSHKWKDLTQGCFEISYTLDGHPNCDVDCDEDLIALRTLAKKFRIGRIDVCIHDLTGSNTSLDVGECGDGSTSSLNVVGSGELISEIDNGSEMTLSLFDQERNQLKSDAWRFAIKGVDQVFIGGASAFRDSLSKYSLVHGFDFIYAKNDAETVKARCRSLHCTWFVKAKVEKPSGLFRIKELMNEHSCGAASLSTSSSRSTSGLIGRIFSEAIRLSPSKRPVDVRKELKKDYGLNMFPCVHGVCALKKSKKDLNDYMERCFFSESYREAYSKCINPVPRIWQNVDVDAADDILLPPLCKRPPGRPRTERIPSTGAKTRKVTCSRCGQAGNILMDTNGAVKLEDFGVSACMFDTGDRQRSRNTFVGTLCWMAPEAKEADLLVQLKALYGDKEQLSQKQTKLVQDENQLLENILRTLLQELVVMSYFASAEHEKERLQYFAGLDIVDNTFQAEVNWSLLSMSRVANECVSATSDSKENVVTRLIGVNIPAWFHKGSLPPPPPSLPLILIGPGTGCAPFRGFADVMSAFEEIIANESGVSSKAAVRWIRELEKADKYYVEAWS
ncbi:hypothetical protein RHSIM_Rhsim05G0021300 [Rhododendron simsii]|uniref:Transposase MuDR plant domain-containing protein n=1 Tax=Rhododendron simsii TaxID=118357 RepID=A0A834H1C2_RHOSS|nr:hypothetical protein RHSIM_Rhsim05G0021300 [Rhododendron simsii]